jgi:hypothetical protein
MAQSDSSLTANQKVWFSILPSIDRSSWFLFVEEKNQSGLCWSICISIKKCGICLHWTHENWHNIRLKQIKIFLFTGSSEPCAVIAGPRLKPIKYNIWLLLLQLMNTINDVYYHRLETRQQQQISNRFNKTCSIKWQQHIKKSFKMLCDKERQTGFEIIKQQNRHNYVLA